MWTSKCVDQQVDNLDYQRWSKKSTAPPRPRPPGPPRRLSVKYPPPPHTHTERTHSLPLAPHTHSTLQLDLPPAFPRPSTHRHLGTPGCRMSGLRGRSTGSRGQSRRGPPWRYLQEYGSSCWVIDVIMKRLSSIKYSFDNNKEPLTPKYLFAICSL